MTILLLFALALGLFFVGMFVGFRMGEESRDSQYRIDQELESKSRWRRENS